MSPAGTENYYDELYGETLLLSQEEFAFLAGVTIQCLKLWRGKGRIKSRKIGSSVFIPASELWQIKSQ